MTELPALVEVDDFPGADFGCRWKAFLEDIYQRYVRSVAKGDLIFRGKRVSCQFRPVTDGKHFAFWHMMQEGSDGRSEDDRTIDLERCRRVDWIAWVISNAGIHSGIRAFQQAKRWGDTSWVLWLHQRDYAVILWERKDYFLLKTAFYPVYRPKQEELERDWKAFQARNG